MRTERPDRALSPAEEPPPLSPQGQDGQTRAALLFMLEDLAEQRDLADQAQRDWSAIFDAIRDPIFLHDEKFRIIRANRAYLDCAGLSIEQVQGRFYWEVFPPGDGPLPGCQEALDCGCSKDEELRTAGGMILLSRSFPVVSPDGAYRHSVHVMMDITERHRTEHVLRTLHHAVDGAGDGIGLLDAELKIIHANPALGWLLNCDEQQLLDKPISDSLALTSIDLRQIASSLHSCSDTWTQIIEVQRLGSRPIRARMTISQVCAADAEPHGYVMTLADLSEMEEQQRRITALRNVIESLYMELDFKRMGDAALQSAMELTGADLGGIAFISHEDETLRYRWLRGLPADSDFDRYKQPIKAGQGIAGRVVQHGQSVIVDNYQDWDQALPVYLGLGLKSAMGCPIRIKGQVTGALCIGSVAATNHFDTSHFAILESIARQIGVAAHREHMADQICAERDRAERYLQIAEVIILSLDSQGRVRLINQKGCALLGYAENEIIGQSWFERFIPPSHRQKLASLYDNLMHGQSLDKQANEQPILTRDGSERIIAWRYEIIKNAAGEITGIISSGEDVTKYRASEQALQQVNRALRTLSSCNNALIHAKSEMGLLNEVCRQIVSKGGYRMAWVGKARRSGETFVKPIAASDSEASYLNFITASQEGAGTAGEPGIKALRSGHVQIVQDIGEIRPGLPWQEEAWRHGYASCLSIPITLYKKARLVLNIFSGERSAFGQDEVALLQELADDLVYGIKALRTESERKHIEQSLFNSEARSRAIVENEADGIIIMNTDHVIRYANPAAETLLSKSEESLINTKFHLLTGTDDALIQIPQPNGTMRDAEIRTVATEWDGEDAYIVSLHDISDRRRLEEERQNGVRTLAKALSDTIQAMATALEKRDPYTAGHQQRVAELAVAIGGVLGLDQDRLQGLRMGAMIHDIGKIYVPAEILNRPGRLTPTEFDLIKSHATVGHDIIKDIHFPWPIAEMVVQHHERLDGSGYPQGLKGDGIILEARILGVADVVEAMASHRPYRPGLGIEAALDEIRRNQGRFYDPDVARACLALFTDNAFTFSH